MAAQASPMLVLVALSGRSLRLDVHSGVRVDAVQQALLSFTGIPLSDQLLMYNGSRLDPARTLGSYGLPVADAAMAEDCPVFLYCRSFLKLGAKVPDAEVLPDIAAAVPAVPSALQLHHPLHSAPSPLVRGLPQTELQFQHDLALAKAYWDASQLRVQRCRQLLSEQEVQARAADAARANVQVHFNHITTAYQAFLTKFSQQHAAHAELLGSYEADLAQLSRIPLHPGLQTRAGWRTLEDLTPVAKMRQWGEHCRRSHDHFGVKVSELGALLQGLKSDVEALLAQSPSIDLDQLGGELCQAEGASDELSLVVQLLAKDLRAVRELVEKAVEELAAPVAGSRVQDACAAMQSMAEAHSTQLLPQVRQLDERTQAFCVRCADAKSSMTGDVVAQLQRISGQQSRIRDLKAKMAAFNEVLTRQEAAFVELKMAHRIPTAYRMMLAECMRQAAWQELFSQQAARLEEHLGKLRAKEAARRTALLQQVERYLPNEAVARAGLMQEPSRCSLALSPPEQPLIPVSAADLQWVPWRPPGGIRASSFMGGGGGPPPAAEMAAEMAYRPPMPTAPPSLELEVAMLKSELGSQIAAACMRELSASEAQQGQGRAAGGAPGGGGPPASVSSTPAIAAASPPAPSSTPEPVTESDPSSALSPAPSSGPVPSWAAPEELLESMRRALRLKDDLLDRLQAQVRELTRTCEEQKQQLKQGEGLGGGRSLRQGGEGEEQQREQGQGQGGQEEEQRQGQGQRQGADVETLAVSQAVHGRQHGGGRAPGVCEANAPVHMGAVPPASGVPATQAGASAEAPGPFASASSSASLHNSLGPVGPSSSGPPSLVAPQPLVLGPIALAALSAGRPGSAGPPTLRSGVLPSGCAVAVMQSGAGGGAEVSVGVGAPLVPLTTFSSAPGLGAMRPSQRHSLGSLGDAAVLQPHHYHTHLDWEGQPTAVDRGPQQGRAHGQTDTQQSPVLGEAGAGRVHLQGPSSGACQSPVHPEGAGSVSEEYGLSGGTFSMHDSMAAGAMDEATGAACSSPDSRARAAGEDVGGEGEGECESGGRSRGEGVTSTGSDVPDAPPQFGSLPFASSLPRFGSLTSAGWASMARQQSGGSSGNLPNAVLASMMRVVGQEPEPLPWAHLRQSPPPARAADAGVGTASDRGAEILCVPVVGTEHAVAACPSAALSDQGQAAVGGGQVAVAEEATSGTEAAEGACTHASGGQGFEERAVATEGEHADVPDEEAPDLDDIMGGEATSSGLTSSGFISAVCD